jgi:DNA-binding NtrC family response regulator
MGSAILIVDNDSHSRESLQNALLTERYLVISQKSGLDAVANCVQIKPEVVLLGISMPNMSELAILEGIRLSSPSVPVVILCGDATADCVKDVLNKGVSGIIVKPFSVARVLEVVKKCVTP